MSVPFGDGITRSHSKVRKLSRHASIVGLRAYSALSFALSEAKPRGSNRVRIAFSSFAISSTARSSFFSVKVLRSIVEVTKISV